MKKTFFLIIISFILLSNTYHVNAASLNKTFVLSTHNMDTEHRYVIFLNGINSHSSENGPPLDGKYQKIENALHAEGFSKFVYFSYSAATTSERGEVMCTGWGQAGCTGSANLGDLASLDLSPEYTKEHTQVNLNLQADALEWLIGQIVYVDPQAKIDLIGFSLGGIVISNWGSRSVESAYSSHINQVVIINSPVGGFALAGEILNGCGIGPGFAGCELIKWKMIDIYGEEVLTQLQYPQHNARLSIVDELSGILEKYPFTSIQSSADYMVNSNSLPICLVENCDEPELVPVGTGTQRWIGHQTAHHNLVLSQNGLTETPLTLTSFSDYMSKNHNEGLQYEETASWVVEALTKPIYHATPQGFPYDIIVSGESVTLLFEIQNTGNSTWYPSAVHMEPTSKNKLEDLPVLSLPNFVEEGEKISLEVILPTVSGNMMQTVEYELVQNGESFNERITGYVFILPEKAGDLEKDLREKIDKLIANGEQKIEDIVDEVLYEIQQQLQNQVQQLLEELFSECQATAGLMTVGVIGLYMRRRKTNIV